MKLYTIVIYKGVKLRYEAKSFWVKLDENNKVCGFYNTLKIAKKFIDEKEGK